MDLMLFTANQLKNLILKQAPEIKGYKKKKKELLIKIIEDNQLDTTELKSLISAKPKEVVRRSISTLVRFD
jgi:hypothetical protein